MTELTPPPPEARLARFAPLPDLVLVPDLARALGVSHRAARDWMRLRVPAAKVGGRWIAERRDLLAALRAPAALCADCLRALPRTAAVCRGSPLPVCAECAGRIDRMKGDRP